MTANAGEIRARLVLNNSEFNRNMKDVRQELENTSFSAQQMDKDFAAIQKASTVAGAAIVGAIGSSVKISADFEKSLQEVRAVSGSTAEEFEKQEEAARRMGSETVFSAKLKNWPVSEKSIA